jgi:E3 ubiquitin-protein ligase TRIP12
LDISPVEIDDALVIEDDDISDDDDDDDDDDHEDVCALIAFSLLLIT